MKVAEIHDVYMAVSGESVCEEVHPLGLTSSIRIAVSTVKDLWVAYTVHRQVKVDTTKRLKISVSTEDGPLVG